MSYDVAQALSLQIAQHVRRLRLAKKWSREELAERAGVNIYTLKHFERFGQISLDRLLSICQSLGIVDEVVRAFKPRQRVSVSDWNVPETALRQRGRRRGALLADEIIPE